MSKRANRANRANRIDHKTTQLLHISSKSEVLKQVALFEQDLGRLIRMSVISTLRRHVFGYASMPFVAAFAIAMLKPYCNAGWYLCLTHREVNRVASDKREHAASVQIVEMGWENRVDRRVGRRL